MEYKESEMSQWFDLSVQKPWQEGVYLVKTESGHKYWSFWDGKEFGWGCVEKDSENLSRRGGDLVGSFAKWRGLSSDPSPKPKRKGNPRVTRYVVAGTVGPYSSDIDSKCIYGCFDCYQVADGFAKKIRNKGDITARVFPSKRFRTPEA